MKTVRFTIALDTDVRLRQMSRKHANLALSLSFEFQKYLMAHPEVADEVPEDAVVIFELGDRRAFNQWARETARAQARPGQSVITVRVRNLAPPVSRIRSLQVVS